MNKVDFEKLFRKQLEIAAKNAEVRFKINVPHNFRIRLFPQGTSHGSKLFDFDTALEVLHLDGQLYPLYIDLRVEAVSINRVFTIVYVGASKPDRVPFELTWNYKSGEGPFKQQINEELRIVPD
jgi:hypothetical protein